MDIISVWVWLPGLPVQFWETKPLKMIENHLGEFLKLDSSYLRTDERKVAKILVSLNVRDGLGEEVDIKWSSVMHTQRLDYENVPFHCWRCHHYRHLLEDCHLPLRTRRDHSVLSPQGQCMRLELDKIVGVGNP
jgi:hypothetical protein